MLLGIVVAFGLASSSFLRRELQPLLVFSQSMPTAALAPLLVVWFGLGVAPKALLALLLVFFPVAANLAEGLTQVNPDMLRLLRSYRATRWQTFMKLRLPHAVGYLVAGMKIAAPLALIGAVVGEFVGANRGIGRHPRCGSAPSHDHDAGLSSTALFLWSLELRLGPWLAAPPASLAIWGSWCGSSRCACPRSDYLLPPPAALPQS